MGAKEGIGDTIDATVDKVGDFVSDLGIFPAIDGVVRKVAELPAKINNDVKEKFSSGAENVSLPPRPPRAEKKKKRWLTAATCFPSRWTTSPGTHVVEGRQSPGRRARTSGWRPRSRRPWILWPGLPRAPRRRTLSRPPCTCQSCPPSEQMNLCNVFVRVYLDSCILCKPLSDRASNELN